MPQIINVNTQINQVTSCSSYWQYTDGCGIIHARGQKLCPGCPLQEQPPAAMWHMRGEGHTRGRYPGGGMSNTHTGGINYSFKALPSPYLWDQIRTPRPGSPWGFMGSKGWALGPHKAVSHRVEPVTWETHGCKPKRWWCINQTRPYWEGTSEQIYRPKQVTLNNRVLYKPVWPC